MEEDFFDGDYSGKKRIFFIFHGKEIRRVAPPPLLSYRFIFLSPERKRLERPAVVLPESGP